MIKYVIVPDVLEYLKSCEGLVFNHLEPDESYVVRKKGEKQKKANIQTVEDLLPMLKTPGQKVYVPFAGVFLEQNDSINRSFLSFLIKHYYEIQGDLILLSSVKAIPKEIEQYIVLEELNTDEKEIENIIKEVFENRFHRKPEPSELKDIEHATKKLKGLTPSEVRNLVHLSHEKYGKLNHEFLAKEKLKNIKKKTDLEYDEPNIKIEDIGGLERIKKYIQILKDTMGEDAVAFGIKPPKGILLLGPQGTGKSTIPKAIASYLGIPYVEFNPGAFMSKYYGESERALYKTLKTIEAIGQAVIHIDEIDKVLKKTTDGHEVTARISGMLMEWLAERDTMTPVVMSGNYVENIDTEFTRAGRIDTIFWTWFPKFEERKEIWSIHLKKTGRDPKLFDLDKLAESSRFYTGSEIETAIQIGLRAAFTQKKELTTELLINTLKHYVVPIYHKEKEKFDQMYSDLSGFISASDLSNSDTIPQKSGTVKTRNINI